MIKTLEKEVAHLLSKFNHGCHWRDVTTLRSDVLVALILAGEIVLNDAHLDEYETECKITPFRAPGLTVGGLKVPSARVKLMAMRTAILIKRP